MNRFPHSEDLPAGAADAGRDALALPGEEWRKQYDALSEGAGLVGPSPLAQVELSGDDHVRFLNRLATNAIEPLRVGTGCETFFTDAKGHIVAYALVFARSESLWLCTVGSRAEDLVAHLDRYLVREKVKLRDASSERRAILLAGRRAAEVLGRIVPRAPPADRLGGMEAELARFFEPILEPQAAPGPFGRGGDSRRFRDKAWAWIHTIEPSEPRGFLILVEPGAADAAAGALVDAGARPCTLAVLEARRIEMGWPVYGRDITAENLPQEVGRDRHTLCFTKGCYLGQETIARIESRGHVNQRLVGLRFPTAESPADGTPLSIAGEVVGRVTSAAYSPRLGSALALGYVRRAYLAAGTVLETAHGRVEITALPLSAGQGAAGSRA